MSNKLIDLQSSHRLVSTSTLRQRLLSRSKRRSDGSRLLLKQSKSKSRAVLRPANVKSRYMTVSNHNQERWNKPSASMHVLTESMEEDLIDSPKDKVLTKDDQVISNKESSKSESNEAVANPELELGPIDINDAKPELEK